ncbi:MAG: DNA oxidative demethylase AlkB [Pseudomonadota bacterium]
MTNADLFADLPDQNPLHVQLADGAVLLHGFANDVDQDLLAAIDQILLGAPLRHMSTPGGYRMSVAMSNCGQLGWVTDRRGYRYDGVDPVSARPWPPMPQIFLDLARRAADQAGFAGFVPDACLINRYEAGAKMSLHQDKNERDPSAPIVSVSLGLPAIFLFGGVQRSERAARLRLTHGDVVVWGGAARFAYHGIAPLAAGNHPATGQCRINLTFRKAALK